MDFWKTIQALTITLICRMSVDSKLVLKGSKQKLSDGSEVLLFTCSSQNNTEIPYAEFLVNDKSIASSTYNAESKECHFKHEEKNCDNVCKCNSDGRSHTWTFPLPSSSKITQYACHMFINNNNRPEQANIIFNGTDFVNQKDDVDNLVSSTIPSKDSDGRKEQSHNQGIYAILITILLLMICGLVFYIYNHSKINCKESPDGEAKTNMSPQESHPLISFTDTETAPLISVTDTESPDGEVKTNMSPQLESPDEEVKTNMSQQLERAPLKSFTDTEQPKQSLTIADDTESPVRVRSVPGRARTTCHSDIMDSSLKMHSEDSTLYRRKTRSMDIDAL